MAKKAKKELVKVAPTKTLSPFKEMETKFHEMEKRFEDFFRKPFSFLPSWMPMMKMPGIEEFAPSIDILTEGDNVVVKAELPGMKKEDIDVALTEDTVTISGEKKKEEKVEKKDYHSIERSYGSFKRSFSLPSEVQTDKASAKFKDGVLEIRIPKTEEAKKKEKKVMIE
ncbi:MAG TPA: Hsp20/alpha crystallin family protein [Thermodesulfovibrionales bacterium]|jgi:HSP20 family protein|nr:Hsp20/alpha crystallin family protein [Thermodesulfovibrionales bacterium]